MLVISGISAGELCLAYTAKAMYDKDLTPAGPRGLGVKVFLELLCLRITFNILLDIWYPSETEGNLMISVIYSYTR